MRKYLTADQIADRYHTTVAAIHQRRHRGGLPPALRLGKRVLWAEDEIDAFDDAHREPPPEAA